MTLLITGRVSSIALNKECHRGRIVTVSLSDVSVREKLCHFYWKEKPKPNFSLLLRLLL